MWDTRNDGLVQAGWRERCEDIDGGGSPPETGALALKCPCGDEGFVTKLQVSRVGLFR